MTSSNGSVMLILSSPSGAGKTTLTKKIQQKYQNFKISVSHTTRKPRPNELEGVDYFFINHEEFKKKINVNCISPGFIKTEMTDKINEDFKKTLIAKIPSGDLGKGEDVANSAVFLASEMSDYITGETIHVNGGMYMA